MKSAMTTAMIPATTGLRPVLFVLLVTLSGCLSLSRGAPAQQHYVLGAGQAAESPAPVERSTGEGTVGMRPPRLAEYLTSPFIVVRLGAHRIELSEFDRWGEDLARGINRTLTAHLAARSPGHRVESAPWPPGTQPEILIQVHVLRFEGVALEGSSPSESPLAPVGEAHLLATWEILHSRDGSVLRSGTTEVRSSGWRVGDFDALVGLLDAGLAALAQDLTLGLEGLP
jgi:uncharacterized lipoprotein YmbA